jgi:glutathione S-transferase
MSGYWASDAMEPRGDILDEYPNLGAYVAHGEARPAKKLSTLNWRFTP